MYRVQVAYTCTFFYTTCTGYIWLGHLHPVPLARPLAPGTFGYFWVMYLKKNLETFPEGVNIEMP